MFAQHPVEVYRSSAGQGSTTATFRARGGAARTLPSAPEQQPKEPREWSRTARQVRLRSLAKRSKHKPHRQHFYQALKRLYHMRYVPGGEGWRQYVQDRLLVSSIQAFDWCS